MKPLIDPINTRDGQFHDYDPQTGEEATIVTSVYANDTQAATRSTQREVISILTAAGIKPAEATNDQLLTALKALFLAEDDTRVSGALQKDKNLSDLADKAKAREALSLDKVGNYRAVHQGGQEGMGTNDVILYWNGKATILQIDATSMGALFCESHPPTPAQSNSYPMWGGYLNPGAELAVISGDQNPAVGDFVYSAALRATLKGRGAYGVADGASCFLHVVEHVGTLAYAELAWNGFGSAYSFRFTQNGDLQADGKIYAGGAFMPTDGNIYGPVWGGYLSNYIAGQIGAVNNNIAAQINDVRNWVYQNFVNSSRQASAQWSGGIGGGLQVPAGCTVIGARNNGSSDAAHMGLLYAAQQILVNGSWMTIGLA